MRRAIPIVTLWLVACAAAGGQLDRASPESYTRSAAEMAAQVAPEERFEAREALTLWVAPRSEGADAHEIHLDQPWTFCAKAPGDCDAATRRWIEQAMERIEKLREKGPG